MKCRLSFLLHGIILLSLFFLFSCVNISRHSTLDSLDVVAEKVIAGNFELISCDLTKLKDTVYIPLSYLVEDLQMVRLDSRDEALVGSSSNSPFTTITEKYVLVRSSSQIAFAVAREW